VISAVELAGHIVMRRQIPIILTPTDRAIIAKWSAWTISVTFVVCSLVLFLPIFGQPPIDHLGTTSTEQPLGSTCAPWDDIAKDAITRVARSKQDTDLHQLDHMTFLMRRARRSCQLGLITVACQDYRAIVRTVPEFIEPAIEASWSCWPFASGWVGDSSTRLLK
jgi:hypothetical protein